VTGTSLERLSPNQATAKHPSPQAPPAPSVRHGIPANRLAAASFGENEPLDPADTPAAYAKNRRVEIRVTER